MSITLNLNHVVQHFYSVAGDMELMASVVVETQGKELRIQRLSQEYFCVEDA